MAEVVVFAGRVGFGQVRGEVFSFDPIPAVVFNTPVGISGSSLQSRALRLEPWLQCSVSVPGDEGVVTLPNGDKGVRYPDSAMLVDACKVMALAREATKGFQLIGSEECEPEDA